MEHDFGEKKTEYIDGNEVEVWQSPKYIEAKRKAIELIESDKYKGILSESDFWILMNKTKSGKMAYTGLIISHDGCLKVNDQLEENLKFKPECVSVTRDGYNNSLVFSYMCPSQGLYEVGEVSKDNCRNGYPYAMALKRCMDRVILKNSKIAYAGIYSDSESDEFAQQIEEKEEKTVEEEKASEKQLVGINKVSKCLGLTTEQLIERVQNQYQVGIRELSQSQADELLNNLTKELKEKAEKKNG